MQDKLTSGRMAHEDYFSIAKFARFVVFDISYALSDLICVSVEMSKTPCLVGGGEI